MKILDLIPGSEHWKVTRLEHYCASEAPVVMNESKFMTRDELLDLKAGWKKAPTPAFKQKLYDDGHLHEEQQRKIIEFEELIDLSPLVAQIEIDGISLLASLDGVNSDTGEPWEHKDWNKALAENVINKVLEPHFFWQLEHQCIVLKSKSVRFTCSDGTTDNREEMTYRSIPKRRKELVAAWKQFDIDCGAHEIKAKKTPVLAKAASLPVVECEVDGSLITTNFVDYLPMLEILAEEQMGLELSTDQQFADKEEFNKQVKKARAELKEQAKAIVSQFVSLDEFQAHVKQADSILQKMQSHGERQVKDAKEAKKQEIINSANDEISAHLSSFRDDVNGLVIPYTAIDYASLMKGRSNFEKIESAVNGAVADLKIAISEQARIARTNLDSLSELASEHKFLFADSAELVLKDNEDLINLIKMRISEHEKAEADRIEKERQRIKAEEKAKAEAKAQREAKAKAEKERERIRNEEREKAQADEKQRREKEDKDLADKKEAEPIAPDKGIKGDAEKVYKHQDEREIIAESTADEHPDSMTEISLNREAFEALDIAVSKLHKWACSIPLGEKRIKAFAVYEAARISPLAEG